MEKTGNNQMSSKGCRQHAILPTRDYSSQKQRHRCHVCILISLRHSFFSCFLVKMQTKGSGWSKAWKITGTSKDDGQSTLPDIRVCVCVLRSASFLQVTLTLLDSDISIDISSFIINIAREQKRVSRVFVVRGRSVNAVTECLYLSEISSHIASQRFSFFNEKSWCKNVRKRPFLAFREAK